MVKNVESNTQTDFPSDHFLVETRLKIKLAKHRGRPPDKSNEWKKTIKPTEENQIRFNDDFKNHYKEWASVNESANKEDLDQKVSAFQYAIVEAAKANIEKKPAKPEDASRSPELQNLFAARKRCRREGKYEEAKKTTYKIRKQIRKDRLDNTIKDLEDSLWHDIKKAKTAFVPSHTQLLNKDGKPCTFNEPPNILADYYENTQWPIDHDREKETPTHRIHPTRILPQSRRTPSA